MTILVMHHMYTFRSYLLFRRQLDSAQRTRSWSTTYGVMSRGRTSRDLLAHPRSALAA